MNYRDYSLYLYKIFNNENFSEEVVIPNDHWKEFIEFTYDFYKKKLCSFKYCNDLDVADFESNNKMIIGYSGGRDSLCSLLKNKESFDVSLIYHCEGLNKSYRNETNVVNDVSKQLNVPCYIHKFESKGKKFYLENPIKNNVIVGLMADIMCNNNISNCSMGMYMNDSINVINGNDYYSDYREPMELFVKAIKKTFINFNFVYAFNEQCDAVYYLLKNHRDKLELLQSCMLPDMYRKSLSAKNKDKFGIDILKNRCGCSCRKCIQELYQIAYFDKKVLDSDLNKHCIDFLKKDLKKITNVNTKNMTDDEILNSYFNFESFKKLIEK